MPRRSWRDLAAEPPRPGTGAPVPAPPRAPDAPAGSEMLHRAAAGDTRLASLLAEREQLESRLAGLTGPPGREADPRFPVTGLRERRAETAAWAAVRDAARTRRPRHGGRGSGLRRSAVGRAGRVGPSAPLRSGLSRFDQVRSALDRSDAMLERPRQLADGLAERWERAEEEVTAPMDRVGSYAEARDRVLDADTGGSGDLFARAEAARRRALDRRSEQTRQERRAARRHEQLHERRSTERRDAERLDRRTATGKGV